MNNAGTTIGIAIRRLRKVGEPNTANQLDAAFQFLDDRNCFDIGALTLVLTPDEWQRLADVRADAKTLLMEAIEHAERQRKLPACACDHEVIVESTDAA